MDSKTLVYFGFPNKDIPWGGWHVTVCGRTNLSTKDMTNAVRRAIKAADLEMDDSTIVDWCNERDCFIERGFIWIKNKSTGRSFGQGASPTFCGITGRGWFDDVASCAHQAGFTVHRWPGGATRNPEPEPEPEPCAARSPAFENAGVFRIPEQGYSLGRLARDGVWTHKSVDGGHDKCRSRCHQGGGSGDG